MEFLDTPQPPTVEETVESLAQTVAHLALQLTVAQLQLRVLGSAVERLGILSGVNVKADMVPLAEAHAGAFLRANMGPTISEMVDIQALERQVVEYLATE